VGDRLYLYDRGSTNGTQVVSKEHAARSKGDAPPKKERNESEMRRSALESDGRSSRGGRPNRPDEDAFYSSSRGLHLGEIGGTAERESNLEERRQGLAEALNMLDKRTAKRLGLPLPITSKQIQEAHQEIQNLIQSGQLNGIDVVADGVGGQGSGEYASSIATFIFVRDIARQLRKGDLSEEGIRDAVMLANETISSYSNAKKYVGEARPGTTFVA